MAHYSTINDQITAFIPRHDFDYQANSHLDGQKFSTHNRLTFCQKNLIDLTGNLTLPHRRYHLAMKMKAKSTLFRVSKPQPATLYETM